MLIMHDKYNSKKPIVINMFILSFTYLILTYFYSFCHSTQSNRILGVFQFG